MVQGRPVGGADESTITKLASVLDHCWTGNSSIAQATPAGHALLLLRRNIVIKLAGFGCPQTLVVVSTRLEMMEEERESRRGRGGEEERRGETVESYFRPDWN